MKDYIELNPSRDLTTCALEEALNKLPAAKVYTIWINPYTFEYTKRLLSALSAISRKNPFCPYVNIGLCEHYEKYEWSVQADNGDKVGSVI